MSIFKRHKINKLLMVLSNRVESALMDEWKTIEVAHVSLDLAVCCPWWHDRQSPVPASGLRDAISIAVLVVVDLVIIRVCSLGIGTQQQIKDNTYTGDKHQSPQEQ